MLIVWTHVLKKYFLNECKFSEEESYSFKNICAGLQDGKESEASMSSEHWASKASANGVTSNTKHKVWFNLETRTQHLLWLVTGCSAYNAPHKLFRHRNLETRCIRNEAYLYFIHWQQNMFSLNSSR